jgi:hypothetical protein
VSEFAVLPDRAELERLLGSALADTGCKVVSMELEHVEVRNPPFRLTVLVDRADGKGFTFNHDMPDLDLLPHDVRALAKVIRQHMEVAGVH